MPISKFKFVSPGVQVAEIDNSQLPQILEEMGPVIIGRAERGPALRPVKVGSFSEFVEVFGTPKGGGLGQDVWRNGGVGLAPTYGVYAAQAYLRNNNPVTFVRLLGRAHSDATLGGRAGWNAGLISGQGTTDGGAYGLWVINSTGTLGGATGTLAATFYMTDGSMRLRGVDPENANTAVSGACTMIRQNARELWQMEIFDGDSLTSPSEVIAFDLDDENSKNYVRKVFNTNPTLTNNAITPAGTARKKYWLGESYRRATADIDPGNRPLGLLLPLMSGTVQQSEQNRTATKAETPWIVSQDLGGDTTSYDYQKLFKFVTLEPGEWEQGNFKISITNVKASDDPYNPYGTFSVELRMAKDSDNAKQIVERYSLCNLNPNSNNYVAKKIGDMYAVWSDTERRYREYGNNLNESKYFRIQMNSDVDNAVTNESYLPFGYEGPLRFKGFTAEFTNAAGGLFGDFSPAAEFPESFVRGAETTPNCPAPLVAANRDIQFSVAVAGTPTAATCSYEFPTIPLRANSTQGRLSSPKDAYFGIDTTMETSTRFEDSYKDLVRAFPSDLDAYGDVTVEPFERPYIFTLEDLTELTSRTTALGGAGSLEATSSTDVWYFSGSRAAGRSLAVTQSNTWNNVLTRGFDSFTLPFQGGFDGLDITEADPFRNEQWVGNGTPTTSYAFNSVKMAIDACSDPEVVECNMMTMPALTNTALTEHIVKVCEDRADALAIIDIEHGYKPPAENNQDEEDRAGNIDDAVDALSQRGLNSSYGCCFYPWVQARDSETGKTFWCPPSVAAIGTFSSSQKKSELWFAPAGFNRGGLTEGSAGIPIVNVKQRLTSKDRDALYEVNINPIASFPAEGIVIFGQKTLQTTQSALDRINVRRLMIYVKKEISRIAALILFDQNVQTTWDRFTGQVVPFLESIQTRLGLTDFKVILDESTTTPDLIDRNILYAKIFLKPARAIEFIAIDFVITSTGASFED